MSTLTAILSLAASVAGIVYLWYRRRRPKMVVDEALALRREASQRVERLWYSKADDRIEKLENEISRLNDRIATLRILHDKDPAKPDSK